MSTKLTLLNNTTPLLWKKFMPRLHEIGHIIQDQYFALQVYDDNIDFKSFDTETQFEMWAGVEVVSKSKPPRGMSILKLPAGKYAVFIHKGHANTFYKTTEYIFNTWLPKSKYHLDQRPHFQLMDKNYKPNDASNEEEVWIPIK